MTTPKKLGILAVIILIVAELFLTWFYPFSMISFNKSVTYQPNSLTQQELLKSVKRNQTTLLKQNYKHSKEAKKLYSFLEKLSQKKEEKITIGYLKKVRSELGEMDGQYQAIYEKERNQPHSDAQTLSSLKNLHEGFQQKQRDLSMMSPSIHRKGLKTLYGNFYSSLKSLDRFTFRWYTYVKEESHQ